LRETVPAYARLITAFERERRLREHSAVA
jgi:hypothetical protein